MKSFSDRSICYVRTFGEEDGHEETERDAGDGKDQQKEEEQGSVRLLQNAQRSAAVPIRLHNDTPIQFHCV